MIGKFETGQIVATPSAPTNESAANSPEMTIQEIVMRPRVILELAPRGLLWRPNRRTCFAVGGHSFLQLYRWLCHNFCLFLLLSSSRPDALKRAQLDHLRTHTLKGP